MPNAIPLATYRLQLTRAFGFADAANIVPYLSRLGISHLYLSPFLRARPGSTHGYDIVDHSSLNPELGGEEAFDRLVAALRDADMGLIMDMVPNHMAVGHADNAWWIDVLEHGPRSRYANFFDIAWELLPHRRGPGVLLPILGKSYGEALADGEIELRFDRERGKIAAWYFTHFLPINTRRYGEILRFLSDMARPVSPQGADRLAAIADLFPAADRREHSDAHRQLAESCEVHNAIEQGLAAYGSPAEGGVARMHRLLERQYYRLACWKLAPSTINYRRFFDVNELAGLRVENMRAFRETHRKVFDLIASGRLQGLRLDHIDGLADPIQYARRLKRMTDAIVPPGSAGIYTVMEKILSPGEAVPSLKGIAGTTGYECLNVFSRVLLDEPGRQTLEENWRRISPNQAELEDVLLAAKSHVLDTIMASEFRVLTELLERIAAGHYSTRDFAPSSLTQALKAYVLQFQQYRTYVTAETCPEDDRRVINGAIERARVLWPSSDVEVFDFLRDVATLDLARSERLFSLSRLRQFVRKLQQFTGPVMAKSLEDTTFYRYHSLLALNEVGGEAHAPALTVQTFHETMVARQATTPHGLTATSTHDTKRGEDARARLLSLAELADEWSEQEAYWHGLHAKNFGDAPRPTREHEYMLHQALIGSFDESDSDLTDRLGAYAVKAAREGKQSTNWLQPNEAYERHLTSFVKTILDPVVSAEFLHSLTVFFRRCELIGALKSLAQITLKTLCPGVPDFYQGSELWEFSLVDPDNRRAVDFARRCKLLQRDEPWDKLTHRWKDGGIKLALTARLLDLRHRFPSLVTEGSYSPVNVDAGRPDVIAFLRENGARRLLVVVQRSFAGNTDGGRRWPERPLEIGIALAPGAGWRDALGATHLKASGDRLEVSSLLPVAVLEA